MSPPIVTWSISAAAAAATGSTTAATAAAVAVAALTSTTAHSISVPSTKYAKGSPALKALSLFDSEELESLSLSNDSSSIALASLDNLSLDASSSSSSSSSSTTSQASSEIKSKQTKDHNQQQHQQKQSSSSFYKCLRLFPLCILRPPTTGDASKDIYKFIVPEWNGKRASGVALHEVKCGEVVNTFALDEFDYYVFGRQPIHPTHKGTGILLDHISTSRQHAVIFHHRMHDLSYLVDLDSAHGTFLNGKKLTPYQPVAMTNRNVITFGLAQQRYIVRQFPKLSQIRERIINHDAASSETDSQTKFHTCLNSMISYSNISRDDLETEQDESDIIFSDSFEIGNMQPCHAKSSSEGNYIVDSLKNQPALSHHCHIKRSKSLSFLNAFSDTSKQGFSTLGRDQSFTSLPSLEDPDAPSYQSNHMKHSRSMSSSRRVSFSIHDPEIIPVNMISKSHSTTSLCKLALTESSAESTPRDTLTLSKIKEVEQQQQRQDDTEVTAIAADIQSTQSSKANITECGSSHDESFLNFSKLPDDLSKRRSLSLSISISSTLDIFQSPRKKLCNTTRY